jgi:SAM-dependent methyltransferase
MSRPSTKAADAAAAAPSLGLRQRIAAWWQGVRIRQIGRAQEREIRRLLDPESARGLAGEERYCRLPDALPAASEGATKVLELGCGPGKYAALLGSLGYDVTAADPLRFDDWKRIAEETGAAFRDGVYAEELPFEDDTFDCATFLGTLLYLTDPDQGIAELSRVVKPNAPIVVRTVNRTNHYTERTGRKLDPASRNLYTMDELIALLERHGLIIEEQFSYGFWPARWTDLWWYMVNVWLPPSFVDRLSDRTDPEHRVNLIVFAKNRA